MFFKTIKKIGWSKFLLWGFIVGFLFIVLDMIVAMVQMPILVNYASLPVWKNPGEYAAGMAFDIINGLFLVSVYLIISKSIPGKGLMKGVCYGIIVGLFRVIMRSFSNYVMIAVPTILLIVESIVGFIEIVILCVILVWVKNKLKILLG